MKKILFAIPLVLCLVACSRRQSIKPITIDKAELDVAGMNRYFKSPADSTNWHCLIASPIAESDEDSWKRVQNMTAHTVYITDKAKVLATGQIAGITTSQGKYIGLNITFPTPQIRQDLESTLGIHHIETPLDLREILPKKGLP